MDPQGPREEVISVKTLWGKIHVKAFPDETIYVLKKKAVEQVQPGLNPALFGLRQGSGSALSDAATVGDCGLDSLSTALELLPGRDPVVYEPQVRDVLKSLLQDLSRDQAPLFVFIGLGCCDSGHGSEVIKRQQCPDAVLAACNDSGLKLVLVLIDAAFPAMRSPQIYDVDQNWKLAKVVGSERKVRRYAYEGKPAFQLWICATPVLPKEYGGELKTLAEQDLLAIGGAIAAKGGYLISGNFYADASKEKPQVAIGADANLIRKLGFKPTGS